MSDTPYTDAVSHLEALVDTVIWMSGSSDFAPDGRAGEVWPEHQGRLFAAIGFLNNAKERV